MHRANLCVSFWPVNGLPSNHGHVLAAACEYGARLAGGPAPPSPIPMGVSGSWSMIRSGSPWPTAGCGPPPDDQPQALRADFPCGYARTVWLRPAAFAS
jgi:hypothetical protein